MNFIKCTLITTFIFLSIAIIAQSSKIGFALPESIISYGNRYYVSNIGLNLTTDKDGDGFISEINEEGEIVNQYFLPQEGKLNAPKGMAVIKNILYVTDIDRIVGFNLKTREIVFELDLSTKASFLNDLASADNNTLFVTETLSGKVFKINIFKKSVQEIAGEYPSANGLVYHSKSGKLYLSTMGPDFNGNGIIYSTSVSNNDGFKPLLNSPKGIFDGIAFFDDTHLIVSDWVGFATAKGRMILYDLINNTTEVLPIAFQSPADFYFNAKVKKLYVPQTLANDVFVVNFHRQAQGQKVDNLTHFGLIKSFVGGLYGGYFTYEEIKKYGDFGIFAPENLDGEGTAMNGKFIKTTHLGKSDTISDSSKISVAFVNFFQKDFSFNVDKAIAKQTLYVRLDSLLNDENGIYAIKISGLFKYIKTRAFPPVEKPFPELSSILNKQQFFEYHHIEGTLVGYKLPVYIEGINIPGYHFHFLPNNLEGGGHVLDFSADKLGIEVDILSSFSVVLPKHIDFKKFDFKKNREKETKSVESGADRN